MLSRWTCSRNNFKTCGNTKIWVP